MAHTFTQLHIHIVFAVKSKENRISESLRITLEKYITQLVSDEKCKVLAIYCNPDHLHLFIGLHPTICISDLVKKVKSNSSLYINKEGLFRSPFHWQNGFGAFAYSKSHEQAVIEYIQRQPEHHQKHSFKDEYIHILKKLGINYDMKYAFDE